MIMTRLICLLIVISFLGFGSCKKKSGDADFCGTSWTTKLADKISAMSTAAMTYATNPTVANCNAYKTSVNAYIDALEPYGNCSLYATGTNKAQFDAAIADARDEIAQTTCQ